MPEQEITLPKELSIRLYEERDELSWVRCRLLSFLDCSYFDDVHRYRELYENPAVCVVATRGEHIVGFLDIEYEEVAGQVCSTEGERGGVMWHLGVLPEYRQMGVATKMFEFACERLRAAGVFRIQAWTQDDVPANSWYRAQGFEQFTAHLNVFARGLISKGQMSDLLPGIEDSWKYLPHIRSLNFEAPCEAREELERLSYRIHEVRGYELNLQPETSSNM
ncbi:GNAT family N-acetyltransferase [Rothia sp. P6271]|uniref:GNAT family N-acetyltransferase n=1 Tax=Rothia sp. P6271 TaxID=3402659 RepID=UPI003AC14038